MGIGHPKPSRGPDCPSSLLYQSQPTSSAAACLLYGIWAFACCASDLSRPKLVPLLLLAHLLLQQEQAGKKRERIASEPETELPKQEKKRPKASQQPEEQETPKEFTPFDYSKSDFKAFAGKSRIPITWSHQLPSSTLCMGWMSEAQTIEHLFPLQSEEWEG